MKVIDDHRDEVRLSRMIVDRLARRFELEGSPQADNDSPQPVDVGATNERLVLNGRRLDTFTAVSPVDSRVMRIDDVSARLQQVQASEIVLLLLCGGLSFRSGGEIHPLKKMQGKTLLERQLQRLADSPLEGSACLVVGTPFNELELAAHLANMPGNWHYRVFAGGLAPRLLPSQYRNRPPLIVREPSGQISYNPVGHLEALRWFVLSGAFFEFIRSKVVITVSYSNWGRIFSDTMIALAGMAQRLGQEDERYVFLVELTQLRAGGAKGSMLVSLSEDPDDLRLVKPGYGRGKPRLTHGENILMSTNTWYFNVPNLLARIANAVRSIGVSDKLDGCLDLLQDAAAHRRRDQLAEVFEAAFPVEPQLIPTYAGDQIAFLRAERDMDQLTLIPGASLMRVVKVEADRGVFLKLPSDFEDPAKLAFLYGP